jgi:hypothetical protein
MAATYDPTLATDKDWVRLLIGDRDTARPFFDDAEILAVLEEEQNKYLAAATLAESVLSKGHGLVEKAVDDLHLRWSDNPKSAYSGYIAVLRQKGATLTYPAGKRVIRALG